MLTPLEALADVPTSTLLKIPLDAIEPDPAQPRRRFDTDKLQNLADNMGAIGQRDPIKAYLIEPGRYRLEDGERRWRAAQICGWALIDVRVVARPAEPLPLQVAANELHENLAPGELLDAIARMAALGMNQVQISHHIGRSRQLVNQLQRLNRRHPDLVDAVRAGDLSLRAAFTAAGILQANRPTPREPTPEPQPSGSTPATPPARADRPQPQPRNVAATPSGNDHPPDQPEAPPKPATKSPTPAQAPERATAPGTDTTVRTALLDAVTTVTALLPDLSPHERIWLTAELRRLADALHD